MSYYVVYDRSTAESVSASHDEMVTTHVAQIGTDIRDMRRILDGKKNIEPDGDWVLVECEEFEE